MIDCHFHGLLTNIPEQINGGLLCFYKIEQIQSLQLISKQGFFYGIGIHPWFCKNINKNFSDLLIEKIISNKIPVIGEIGLDNSYTNEGSLYVFEKQLEIAKQYKLPVVLHIYKSNDKCLSLIKKHKIKNGMIHRFNNSKEEALKWVEQGFYISFSFELLKSKKVKQAFSACPLSKILLESDFNPSEKIEYPLDKMIELYKESQKILNIEKDFNKIIKNNLICMINNN